MLSRRRFTNAALATCMMSAGAGCSPSDRTRTTNEPTPNFLHEQQSRLNLGVTIGALVGTAVGIAAYTAFTKSAPNPLVGVFVAAVGGLAGATLTKAAQSYIEFEIEQANGDLVLANLQLRQRITEDGASFRTLANYARSQSQLIARLRNDSSASVRNVRKEMNNLRGQVEQMRAESARAQKTSSTYAPAEQIIDVQRLDPNRQTDQQVAKAMQEADRCKAAYDDLVGQILSNS